MTRPNHVKIRAFDENLEEYTAEGVRLLARSFGHEIDLLDGHMYTEIAEGPIDDIEYQEPEEGDQEAEEDETE